MYVPGYQSEQDPKRLWETIRRHSFGSLICADDGGRPVSTQLPFIRRGERFLTHLAAANPQSRLVADGRPVLCQFLGPHGYISPTWYEEPGSVPTWNYVQVVVSGRLRPLDRDGARFVVEEITGRFKLSQNRSDSDRRRIVTALRAGDATQRDVADLMERDVPTQPARREQ